MLICLDPAIKMDVSAIIIREVKRHPQLYDKKNTGFRMKSQKDDIWEYIGNLVKLDSPSVQNKWKNLRDQYAKEKRKQAAMGISDKDVNWIYFESLKFLSKHVIPRNRSGSKFYFSKNEFDYEDDDIYPIVEIDSQHEALNLQSNQQPSQLEHQQPNLMQSAVCKPEKRRINYNEQSDEYDDGEEEEEFSFQNHSIFDVAQNNFKKIKIPNPRILDDEQLVANNKNQSTTETALAQHSQPPLSIDNQNLSLTNVGGGGPTTFTNDCLANLKESPTPNSAGNQQMFADSDIAFGRMVGERLKEMSKKRRNRMKIEITKIIYAESDDE